MVLCVLLLVVVVYWIGEFVNIKGRFMNNHGKIMLLKKKKKRKHRALQRIKINFHKNIQHFIEHKYKVLHLEVCKESCDKRSTLIIINSMLLLPARLNSTELFIDCSLCHWHLYHKNPSRWRTKALSVFLSMLLFPSMPNTQILSSLKLKHFSIIAMNFPSALLFACSSIHVLVLFLH